MGISSEIFTISSNGFDDLIDITSKVQDIVSRANKETALVNISVIAPTASVITLENESGLVGDFPSVLENIVPVNRVYKHDISWHEGNAHAHLKAALLGNNITLSVVNTKIALDANQKIALIDFDVKPSLRKIVVSVMY